MQTGWALMLEFLEHMGALNAEERAFWHDIGWGVLLRIGNAQHEMIHEENPVEMFLSTLQQIFAQGKAYLRHRDDEITNTPEANCWPKTRAVQCELLGWYDSQFWYLLPKPTYNAVSRFCRDGGVVFPDSERGLGVKLVEQKISLPQGDRNTYRMPFTDNSKPRVWRLHIPEDFAESGNPSTKAGNSGNSGNSGNEYREEID
jgi:hypothetical protein